MIARVALTVSDLIKAVDYNSDTRSRRCTANLTSFLPDRGLLNFVTRSSKSKRSWQQRIFFPDWDVLDEDMVHGLKSWSQAKNEIEELENMDVLVSCNCPAFLYWGSAYLADALDAGEPTLVRYKHSPVPESRPPNIRDPNNDRMLCKHLIAVIRRFF